MCCVFLTGVVCHSLCSQPSSRCATPGLSAATLASLGGTSSRRGSTDTGSVYDPDTSLSELRVRCTIYKVSSFQKLSVTEVLQCLESNPRYSVSLNSVCTHVPASDEPPTAFLLLCPSSCSKCLLNYFSSCMHGRSGCVLWSCTLYLGGMVMCMSAGLSLKWQCGCFIISP